MIPLKAKEILDFIVAICSIVSCIVAVYGVFQVVDFVVDVKPIVVPIANEVKEGNLDARAIFSSVSSAVRHDTVRVRDTIYLPSEEAQKTTQATSLQQTIQERSVTKEEEQRLNKSADIVSEQEKQEIENEEASFRQRMREKMRQRRTNP